MTQFEPENLTEDQVIALLQMLFTNMNQLDSVYYDMFINPVEMDVTFDRYDENGTLNTITLPNRAKDKTTTKSGIGSPEGVVEGNSGQLYIDTASRNLYYKTTSTSYNGWTLIYSGYNFRAGEDYLTPTGEGSNLQALNADNITLGVLDVQRGGTGTGGLTGIIKGNGTNNAYSVATPNVDYLTPNSQAVLINILYPVGSVYMGTQTTCPFASIVGTWTKKATKIITSINGTAPVRGTGATIGFNNSGGTNYGYMNLYRTSYNEAILSSSAGTRGNIYLTKDGGNSGIVADLSSSASYTVNIWERTA